MNTVLRSCRPPSIRDSPVVWTGPVAGEGPPRCEDACRSPRHDKGAVTYVESDVFRGWIRGVLLH